MVFQQGITEYDGRPILLNHAEMRAYKIYTRLKQNIKPWEWDSQMYSGINENMYGRFFDCDICNIEQIALLESERKTNQK